jgi:hypothetical protein
MFWLPTPKPVPILQENIELINMMTRGFPDLPFFRQLKGIYGSARKGKYSERDTSINGGQRPAMHLESDP